MIIRFFGKCKEKYDEIVPQYLNLTTSVCYKILHGQCFVIKVFLVWCSFLNYHFVSKDKMNAAARFTKRRFY